MGETVYTVRIVLINVLKKQFLTTITTSTLPRACYLKFFRREPYTYKHRNQGGTEDMLNRINDSVKMLIKSPLNAGIIILTVIN